MFSSIFPLLQTLEGAGFSLRLPLLFYFSFFRFHLSTAVSAPADIPDIAASTAIGTASPVFTVLLL